MTERRSQLVFVGVQIAVVAVVSLAFAWRQSVLSRPARERPQLRNVPLEVPLTPSSFSGEVVVTDEQLARVLTILRPREGGPESSVNHLDHALRFWGLRARFGDKYLSGEELRRRLTDHRRFLEVFGPRVDPLLTHRSDGTVSVRVQQGRASSSHVDHTLACLAEVGTPLDYPIVTSNGETTLQSMFDYTYENFSLNQVEYEWSAIIFALYMKVPGPEATWQTREGQKISFDLLAERIMRQEQPQGVCFGNHRLHALTVLLKVNEQSPILSNAVKDSVIAYLEQMTALLVRNQSPDGFWHQQWPLRAATTEPPKESGYDTLSNRLLATGHALEWWAYAPAQVQPPREVLARAGQWLVKSIEALTEQQVSRMYPFLTHAGRALSLWRHRDPADVQLAEDK